MPTIRNIDTIKATLLAPATTSHFDVEIGLPRNSPTSGLGSTLRGLLGSNQDRLNLMCNEAVLPGSQLATSDITNDYTGVTERHAHRRVYDETIDLNFYVDAANYLPIKFFEEWISGIVNEDQEDAKNGNYNYRLKYPDDYVSTGLKVIKFERTSNDGKMYSGGTLEYEFVRSYPKAITSMPVNYDGSQLLKCSVQMTYVRYVINTTAGGTSGVFNPFQQAVFNSGGLQGLAANLADAAVDRLTGNDLAGDIAGSIVRRGVKTTARDLLGNVVRSGRLF